MKSIVILYEEKSNLADKNVFNQKNARQLCKEKIENLDCEIVKISDCENLRELFGKINYICSCKCVDFVIFSYDDLLFINIELTKKMIDMHLEYKAEYTFADGYPYGFSPEIIDCGTLRILEELSKNQQKVDGDKKVERNSIYEFIKSDINAYEVESVLSNEDYRLFRFAFHCGKKENFVASKSLFDEVYLNCDEFNEKNADEISVLATKNVKVLKTIPSFYNIQITDCFKNKSIYLPDVPKISSNKENSFFDYEKLCKLIDQISSFSEDAVISLSAWGECFYHKDLVKIIEKILSYDKLCVFLETEGLLIDENVLCELSKIVKKTRFIENSNNFSRLMIAVKLDSFTCETYKKIHKNSTDEDFSKVIQNIEILTKYFPNLIYPQFVRMNENEDEIESFYRYWNEKQNCTGGNFIIQKYNDFSGILPQSKPADLSPLERNPCWHLRRDMTILLNGDVPLCYNCVCSNIIGNVFESSLEEIWKKSDEILKNQVEGKYLDLCRKCDEYYTFNF